MTRERAALGSLCLTAFLASCQQSDPLEKHDFQASDRVRMAVDQIKSPDYLVQKVEQTDSVIRLDISLTTPPEHESEIEGHAISALRAFQQLAGKDDRVAVWVYYGNPLTLQGMAFYSSFTETYHFKTAKELR